MSLHYELTDAPALIDLGRYGKALVDSPVPFVAAGALHCANYPHQVRATAGCSAILRTMREGSSGVISVSPSGDR